MMPCGEADDRSFLLGAGERNFFSIHEKRRLPMNVNIPKRNLQTTVEKARVFPPHREIRVVRFQWW